MQQSKSFGLVLLISKKLKINFGRGSPKEHLGKVWLKLTKWFQRYVQFSKKLLVGDGDDPGLNSWGI
jgi:hypothetical protein